MKLCSTKKHRLKLHPHPTRHREPCPGNHLLSVRIILQESSCPPCAQYTCSDRTSTSVEMSSMMCNIQHIMSNCFSASLTLSGDQIFIQGNFQNAIPSLTAEGTARCRSSRSCKYYEHTEGKLQNLLAAPTVSLTQSKPLSCLQ